MSIVEITDLTVRYASRKSGGLHVLDAISLSVIRGEFLSIIGRSGCGKTTFLHALDGLNVPTSGTIEFGVATMAMVFQRPTLMPWRTVLDNALFGLECRGRTDTHARDEAVALLRQMRLGDHLDDYPHQLSEGMKQRVNLARALLVEPDILLLDEPFSALDVMTRRELQDDLLAQWQARDLTVILVSHSLEEVVYLSDRIVVFSDKPARIRRIVSVGLSRPRAADDEATLALLSRVRALESVMSASEPF